MGLAYLVSRKESGALPEGEGDLQSEQKEMNVT
jgi:hypothetical protein